MRFEYHYTLSQLLPLLTTFEHSYRAYIRRPIILDYIIRYIPALVARASIIAGDVVLGIVSHFESPRSFSGGKVELRPVIALQAPTNPDVCG